MLVNRLTETQLLPAVVGDEATEVRHAIEHLARPGHRRIAHIAGPQNLSTGYNESAGTEAIAKLLAKPGPRPTAILAANDQLAIGVIDGLKAAEILRAWVEGDAAPEPKIVYLPCPLVIRESTGPAPTS